MASVLILVLCAPQTVKAEDWCATGKDNCQIKDAQTKCVGVTYKTSVECTKALKDAADAANTIITSDYTGEECDSICQWIVANYAQPDYKGPIPRCAFTGQCRDTNDLVQLFIEQGRMIFGLIGMVALGAFVYGGFLMVFSFGSPDKVTQGKDVMIAAVVGIIIVFSAYIGVSFLLNTVGVNKDLQAIK